jgi:hypothetical protein
MKNVTAKQYGNGRPKLYVVERTGPQGPNVPPAKSAFVPKCDRETWADAWLNGRASLMKLAQTNKGYGLLGIERAVLIEINNRLRRSEQMGYKVETIYGRAA